jgi:hypothetical protein
MELLVAALGHLSRTLSRASFAVFGFRAPGAPCMETASAFRSILTFENNESGGESKNT